MGLAVTGLDQQSYIELPEKTSGLCESWWWTLRTYAKMNSTGSLRCAGNVKTTVLLHEKQQRAAQRVNGLLSKNLLKHKNNQKTKISAAVVMQCALLSRVMRCCLYSLAFSSRDTASK